MTFKQILAVIPVLILASLLFFYFIPFSVTNFEMSPSGNANFSVDSSEENLQFYPNMRFPSPEISYRIENCTIAKIKDINTAFDEIENITLLSFYPVISDEQIFVTCEERIRENEGMFIAGEGGPTKVILSGEFAVIFSGEIVLIKKSDCLRPNVAIHEILHVLGFVHSKNKDNIMFNVTKCSQRVGDEIPALINSLYSIPGYPDLIISNASAYMNGRFLNLEIAIANAGLSDAGESEITIYSEGKPIKTIPVDSIKIGESMILTLGDIWVSRIKIEQLEIFVNAEFDEISKDNNKIKLEIKKQ